MHMFFDKHQDNLRLAKSLLTTIGPAGTVDDIRRWLRLRNDAVTVDVKPTDFRSLKG